MKSMNLIQKIVLSFLFMVVLSFITTGIILAQSAEVPADTTTGFIAKIMLWIGGGGGVLGIVWKLLKNSGAKINGIVQKGLNKATEVLAFIASILEGLYSTLNEVNQAKVKVDMLFLLANQMFKADTTPTTDQKDLFMLTVKELQKEINDIAPAVKGSIASVSAKYKELIN